MQKDDCDEVFKLAFGQESTKDVMSLPTTTSPTSTRLFSLN